MFLLSESSLTEQNLTTEFVVPNSQESYSKTNSSDSLLLIPELFQSWAFYGVKLFNAVLCV